MRKVSEAPYAMSTEVQHMCVVQKGPHHGPAPIPEEGKWVEAKQITDISAYTHGVGDFTSVRESVNSAIKKLRKFF